MRYSKKIPLQRDYIRLFVKSFEDGEFNYREISTEHQTVTHNGQGASIWNHIFTQISANFSNRDGFEVGIFKRGFWEALYLYDKNTKYLYTFMRYKNFVNLQNGNPENRWFHYCNAMSRLNGQLCGTYQVENEQLSFLPEVPLELADDEKLNQILNDIIRNVSGNIECYAIVLVEQKQGKVKDIQCVIPVEGLGVVYKESWTDDIEIEYSQDKVSESEFFTEETDILLFNQDSVKLEYKEEKKEEKDSK